MTLNTTEKIIISRALGMIETAAALTQKELSEQLYNALEMLEGVLKV